MAIKDIPESKKEPYKIGDLVGTQVLETLLHERAVGEIVKLNINSVVLNLAYTANTKARIQDLLFNVAVSYDKLIELPNRAEINKFIKLHRLISIDNLLLEEKEKAKVV